MTLSYLSLLVASASLGSLLALNTMLAFCLLFDVIYLFYKITVSNLFCRNPTSFHNKDHAVES